MVFKSGSCILIISTRDHPLTSAPPSAANTASLDLLQQSQKKKSKKKGKGQECFRSEGGVCLPETEAPRQESHITTNAPVSLSADWSAPYLAAECPSRPSTLREIFITQQRTKTTCQRVGVGGGGGVQKKMLRLQNPKCNKLTLM